MVCDKDFINHKPHPEPYLKALEHAGVSAEEAIAVEDSERGISSALAAGLRTYAIPRGLSLYGKTGHATGCFKDIREFMDFIRRIER